jgi:hypothetical protein
MAVPVTLFTETGATVSGFLRLALLGPLCHPSEPRQDRRNVDAVAVRNPCHGRADRSQVVGSWLRSVFVLFRRAA